MHGQELLLKKCEAAGFKSMKEKRMKRFLIAPKMPVKDYDVTVVPRMPGGVGTSALYAALLI